MNNKVEWGGRELITDPLFTEGRPVRFSMGVESLRPWSDSPQQWNELHQLVRFMGEMYNPGNLQKGLNADLLDGHHWAEIADLLADYQPLCDYLTALCALGADGLVVKNGATAEARTLTSVHLALDINDGDGLAGDPTFDLIESEISHGLLGGLSDDDHLQYMLKMAGTPVDNAIPVTVGTDGRQLEDSGVAIDPATQNLSGLNDLNMDGDLTIATGSLTLDAGDINAPLGTVTCAKLTADEIDPYVLALEPVGDINPYIGELLEDTSLWARLSDDRLMYGSEEVAYMSDLSGGGAPADAHYLTTQAEAGLSDEFVVTAAGLSILDDATVGDIRSTLGLVIGTHVQAQDAELAALAGLTSAADRLPYFTGSGTAALATFTGAARDLLDDANAAAMLTTLGATPSARNISNGYGITGGGNLTADRTLAVALSQSNARLATAQSISAATYADLTGCSVSLAAGTWLIIGHMAASAANLAFLAHLAITHSDNTVVGCTAQGVPASGSANVHQWANLHCWAVVTPGSTTTYKLRAARGNTTLTNTYTAQDGNGQGVTNNASTNNDLGTGLVAIRLA